MKSQRCKNCGIEKATGEFFFNPKTKTRSTKCKFCAIQESGKTIAPKQIKDRKPRTLKKECVECGLRKPLTDYPVKKKDICAECIKKSLRELYKDPQHKEKVKAQRAKFIEKNREYYNAQRADRNRLRKMVSQLGQEKGQIQEQLLITMLETFEDMAAEKPALSKRIKELAEQGIKECRRLLNIKPETRN